MPEAGHWDVVAILQLATAWVLDPIFIALLLAPGRRGWNWLLRSERRGGIAWRIVWIVFMVFVCGLLLRVGLWIAAGVSPFQEP